MSAGAVTVAHAFRDVASRLRRAGFATPELDARLLVSAAAGLAHEQFVAEPGRPLQPGDVSRLDAYAARRLRHEPVSRIRGVREFWGREFGLGPETLDPRPETETVIEAVLELVDTPPAAILDLGTGSGALLVSLLKEFPEAHGVGVDLSPGALVTARANARRHGVAERCAFVCGSWLDAVGGTYDVVVANPPYIPSQEIAALAPEVAGYDPAAALDGGADGLDAYRVIVPGLARVLRPGGWVVLEVGAGQSDAVAMLLTGIGLARDAEYLRRFHDLAGIERITAAQRQHP